MVRYIIRIFKYFIYICFLMALILTVLVALKLVSGDVNELFKDGYGSLWKIALMFFAVACFYPKFGYVKRGTIVPGSYEEIRGGVVKYMESKGYVLEKEEGENLYFRAGSFLKKLNRVFEDRISLTREMSGFYMEGPSKDVARLAMGLESAFSPDNAEGE